MQTIRPFFMFEGKAEEAMNFYMSLFENASIKNITRYTSEGPGKEGSVMLATFVLGEREFMCIDSPAHHAFTFTPSLSMYVNCTSEKQVDQLFKSLSEGGNVMMPLDKYPFSTKFAWVSDKYGVSWQLSFNTKQD